MASSAVIEYAGKRGTTWRIKFNDAGGKQVMETLGRAADGWTKKKAERALGAKLAEVKRTRWRKTRPVTFREFVQRFEDEYLPTRGLKPSTLIDYKATLRNHLVPALEDL